MKKQKKLGYRLRYKQYGVFYRYNVTRTQFQVSGEFKNCREKGLVEYMENSYRFFQNKECKYYPCHKGIDELNCLFCYCPLYHMEHCPGTPKYIEKEGRELKICTNCTFPHQPENYESVIQILKDRDVL